MNIEQNTAFSDIVKHCNMQLSLSGYVVTDEKWHQEQMQSPWSRIYYVTDGEGVFSCGNKRVKIEPGYVYFAPCGATYGFEGAPSLTKLFFHANIIMPDGYDLFASESTKIVRFQRSIEDIKKFIEWYRSDTPIKHIMLNAEIWKTVSEAAEKLLKVDERKMTYSEPVSIAIEYIREHLSANLKAAEVSNAVFCSVGNLNERFCKELGMTVARYIDGLVMFEARRLLAKGNKSVGEVSAMLGYCDQFYFSRCFTKHFSISPRDYKKLKSDS